LEEALDVSLGRLLDDDPRYREKLNECYCLIVTCNYWVTFSMLRIVSVASTFGIVTQRSTNFVTTTVIPHSGPVRDLLAECDAPICT
jgi:hypothetical protein